MADVINGLKTTFSSWDTCMAKTYCKWPVIAAIILGSLIVLSVLWCVFSCLCCGISLCAACGKCVTCFGCCGACNRSERRRKDPEYHPMPPTPTPYHNGYQPQSNMMYNSSGPQFATFDTGAKRSANVHEDSLPTMPSWDNAPTRRIEDHTPQPKGSDLEMERMLPAHGPISPVRESPYHSDIGAQRLGQHQQHGAQADYYDPPPQPLSPAPTYYSSAPMAAGAMAPATHNRLSPIQDRYDNSYNQSYNTNVAPYPSSRESTQFAASSHIPQSQNYSPYNSAPIEQQPRAMSPPQQSYNTYQTQNQDQNSGARPPSLLQIGRKPIAGSFREV